ncbi:MAG: hypothetical protein H8E72_00845 [Candidatus Marinimicrobia bacterium]|nr:hypothetical protein [Candidatus Neomarinimicrobiota bacterium]
MQKIASIIIMVLLWMPTQLDACAVCYGAADDPMVNGMNAAIFFLLAAIGSILLGVIALTIYFARRAKLVNN